MRSVHFRSCLLLSVGLAAKIVFAQAPPAPTGLTPTGLCAGVDLEWNSSATALSYNIYRSTTLLSGYTKIANSRTLSYRDIDSTLGYSSTYYYYVTAVNNSGEGLQSSTSTTATLAAATTMTAIPFGSAIKLNWGAISGPASLYRFTSQSATSGVIAADFTSAPIMFVDKSAPLARSYYRLYSATKAWVSGPLSSAPSAIPDILSAPMQIVPNPPNGVLPDALTLPEWIEGTIPIDTPSSPDGGPASALSVDLAHGVVSTGAPGVVVPNSIGPDIAFNLQYRTSLAAGNIGSPGLPVGWTHNWDARIIQDGTQSGWAKSFRLVYSSGASEVLTPKLDSGGNPLGTFNVPTGAPYVVTGVSSTAPNSIGVWTSITISGNGFSKQVFNKAVGDPFYRLTNQVISNGTGQLNFTYTSGKLTQIDNGGTSGTGGTLTGLTLTYSNSGGTLSQVASFNSRFTRNYTVSSGQLTAASQLNSMSSEWTYGYTALGGQPYVNIVGTLTPTGTSTSAGVAYNTSNGRANSLTDAIGNSRVYNFSVTDPGGAPVVGARTSTVQDISNNVLDTGTVVCDGLGRLTATKDRLGATTTITYSSSVPSAVTNVQPPTGNPSKAEYDSFGNPTKVTTPYGNYTVYTYAYPAEAPLGRPTKIQEYDKNGTPKSGFTAFAYAIASDWRGPKGYLISTTLPNGGQVNYQYTTQMGNLLQVGGSAVATQSFDYANTNDIGGTGPELYGRPYKVSDGLGNPTWFAYDVDGRLQQTKDAYGYRDQAQYNSYGQATSVSFANGARRLDLTYGVGGKATTQAIWNGAGSTAIFKGTYNDESAMSSAKDALNRTESQTFNSAFGLSTVTNANTQTMHQIVPDTLNRQVSYQIGTGSKRVKYRTQLNSMGVPTSVKRTEPSVSSGTFLSYSSTDPTRMLTSSSSNGSIYNGTFNTSYTYDNFGRVLTATSDGADYTITHTYTYDDEDNVLTDIVSGNGSNSAPLDSSLAYAYNLDGTVKNIQVLSEYDYDFSFWKEQVQYDYSYDTNQNVTQIAAKSLVSSNQLAVVNYNYDLLGRIIAVRTPSATTLYNYNTLDQITSLYNLTPDTFYDQYAPAGYKIVEGGRTHSVLSQFTNMTYDDNGNRKHMDMAVGVTNGTSSIPSTFKVGTADWTYDKSNRLLTEIWAGDFGTTVSQTHGLDSADNLTTLRSASFSVDALSDQLINSTVPYNSVSFDDDGNRKTWKVDATHTLDATDGWDPAGQMSRVVSQPLRYFATSQSIQTNNYDSDGRRILRYSVNNGLQPFYDSFVYSGDTLLKRRSPGFFEYDSSGGKERVGTDFTNNKSVYYIVGPTGPVVEFASNADIKSLTYDPQGSCVATTDGVASNSPWMFYDGYGRPVWDNPASAGNGATQDGPMASNRMLNQPYQYKGQYGYYGDSLTMLYYCMHRFYDAGSGRWISRDPVGLEGGMNTYVYCGGNPVMFVDPNGLEWTIFGFEFSAEVWSNGLRTGGAATLHAISFGHYENEWAKHQIGYDTSLVLANVGVEAASWAVGEAAFVKAGQLIVKGRELYQGYKLAKNMAKISKLGRVGEKTVAAVIDIGNKFKYTINGRIRIADGITRSTYTEIKKVAKLSKIQQITDGIEFATQTGRIYNLYVRKTTYLTKPLLELEKAKKIIIHRIL